MTLVELIVAMGILVILLVVSMAAVVTMTRNTVRAQAVTDATDQLRITFQQLDKEVRYASDINEPGEAGGAIYVEYLVAASAADGAPQCVQWRYVKSSGDLQRRTWEPGAPATVSAWRTTVTRLRNDLSTHQPFVMHRAATSSTGAVYVHQRLDVYLDTGMGTSGDARGGQLDVTLVARNSSASSTTNSPTGAQVCLEGGAQRP